MVVFLNKGKYGKINWNTKNQLIENNANLLLKLNNNRSQIVLQAQDQKNKIDLQELKDLF